MADSAENEENPIVRAKSIELAFNLYTDHTYRTNLINSAFQADNLFVQKLGLYLWAQSNIEGVDFSLLDPVLRDHFAPKEAHDKYSRFHEQFSDLFNVSLQPELLRKSIFGDFNDASSLLNSAWGRKTQGANTFIKDVVQLIERLLTTAGREIYQREINGDMLNIVNANVFSDDKVVAQFEYLLSDYHRAKDGVNLPNGRQATWLEQLCPIVRHFLSGLNYHYFGDSMRDQIFISYSHRDNGKDKNPWFEQLKIRLGPLERNGVITRYWSDQDIRTGEIWRKAIREAIEKAKVAILLINPEFFDSAFIANHELKPIYEAHKRGELRIIAIACGSSNYKQYDSYLADIQWANDPNKPLESLDPDRGERNQAWTNIIDQVIKAFKD